MGYVLAFIAGVIAGSIAGAFSMAMIAGGNPALKNDHEEGAE